MQGQKTSVYLSSFTCSQEYPLQQQIITLFMDIERTSVVSCCISLKDKKNRLTIGKPTSVNESNIPMTIKHFCDNTINEKFALISSVLIIVHKFTEILNAQYE